VPEGDQGPETPGRPAVGRGQAPGTLRPAQPEAVRRVGPRLRVAGKVANRFFDVEWVWGTSAAGVTVTSFF